MAPRIPAICCWKGLIITEDKDDNKIQRRALLLHRAGPEVQDIFDVLPDTGEAKDYNKAAKALNDYFSTQVECSVRATWTTVQKHEQRTGGCPQS